ncbi:MAG: hypothetical protein AUJ12_04570 [Alphaproteobacteria bacterium CG1_02_46_17]|nr:MAG: hypothetical protein AUJ12_04570 [Alphaproteobacteria bacterium CG1_02_46_17]
MTDLLSSDLFAMLELLAPAFCAGLVVSMTHVPLGQEVLRRGIIFIDLAIAQIAALGVVIGSVVFHIEGGIMSALLALSFAVAGSLVFGWLGHKVPKFQEAFIGCAFVLSASLILLVLAGDPHGGEEMQGVLAGQILWVAWQQVLVTLMVSIGVLFVWWRFVARYPALFYILFPVSITFAVQMVGVYLVFASLIIPALASVPFARSSSGEISKRGRLMVGYLLAVFSVGSGLVFSVITDLPAGPVLVCWYVVCGGIMSLIHHIYQQNGSGIDGGLISDREM